MSNQIFLTDNVADQVSFLITTVPTDNPGSPNDDPSTFNLIIEPTYYLNEFGVYDGFCVQAWIPIPDGQYTADLYYSTENFAIDTFVDMDQDFIIDESFMLTDELIQASIFTLNNLTWQDVDSNGDLEGIITDENGNILNPTDVNDDIIYLEAADIQYLIWDQIYEVYAPDYGGTESGIFDETPYGPRALNGTTNAILAQNINNAIPIDYAPDKAGDEIGVILIPTDMNASNPDPSGGGSQYIITTIELSGIGDYVWLDANGNGLQDLDENGVEGVTVELLADLDNNGTIEITEVLDTTTTDIDGFYAFDGIITDNYQVRFIAPTEINGETVTGFTTANVGLDEGIDSDADSNGLSELIDLAPGEFSEISAGLLVESSSLLASIGDFVWHDLNANGIQDNNEPGIEGATVLIANDQTSTVISTTTDANGEYSFEGLQPGEYRLGFVRPDGFDFSSLPDVGEDDNIDSDGIIVITNLSAGDNDPTIDSGFYNLASVGDFVFLDNNEDGIQNTGDMPVEGVKAQLIDATNGSLLASTTTAADGSYLFDDLFPGEYAVEFVAPNGFSFTTADQGGDDNLDSDADNTGLTPAFTLTSGENNLSLDAGLIPLASLGDYVFLDNNEDGIQNTGDTPVQGVTVRLLNSGGIEIAETTTNADGLYLFENVIARQYEVEFVAPTGFTFTTADQGGDDNLDSDVNENGVIQNVTLSAGENNLSLDAGLLELDDPITNPLNIEKLVAMGQPESENEGQLVSTLPDGTKNKPEVMTFVYDPNLTFDTSQSAKKGGILENNALDDDNSSYIVVTEDKDWTNGISGKIYFEGNVNEGDQFDASLFFNGNNYDKFESNTYFYFFDEQGGPLLQAAKYHTSASAPIKLGDKILSATLVTYKGQASDDVATLLPSEPIFFDADDLNDAPEIIIGSEVLFKYVVTNSGDTPLSNVNVTDDQIPSLTYLEGDINNDGLLDVDEEWIYTASSTAIEGNYTNLGIVTANFLGGMSFIASDAANYIGVPEPPPEGDLTQIFGRPQALTFTYIPGYMVETGGKDKDKDGFGDQDGKAKIERGSIDDDNSAYIVVANKKNLDKIQNGEAKTYFAGNVEAGESFIATVDFLNGDNVFDDDTRILVFEDEASFLADEDPLQVMKYRTKGDQPIEIGDVIGSVQLVEYFGETGFYDDADIDPIEAEINSGFQLNGILGQPQGITFTYIPGDLVQTGGDDDDNDGFGDQDGKATIESGFSDDDSSAYIVVSNKKELDKIKSGDDGANIYFAGNVEAGESFTASVDFLNGGDFLQDDTYILLFENEAAFLADDVPLQVMKYRTQGDQPIQIGDSIGSVQVAEYFGETGSFDDANIDPIEGEVNAGFELNKILDQPQALTFTYNPGDTVQTDQPITDAKIDSGFSDDDSSAYLIFANTDNLNDILDGVGEIYFAGNVEAGESLIATVDFYNGGNVFDDYTKIFVFEDEASFLAGDNALQQMTYKTKGDKPIKLGDTIGSVELVEYFGETDSVDDPDIEPIDGEISNAFAVNPIFGQPEAITFTYNPGDLVQTGGDDNDNNGFGDQDGKAEIESGLSDNDNDAYLVVSNKNNLDEIKDGRAKTYFAGNVEAGESFTASVDFLNGGDFLQDDTYTLLFEDEAAFLADDDPLQVMKYRTEGDQPIHIGDIIGSVQVAEYFGETGSSDDVNIDPITGEINRAFELNKILGKPVALTFEYNDSDTLFTNQDSSDAKILVNNGIDDDGTSHIIVTDEEAANDALAGIGNEYFVGDVSFDTVFEASSANAGTSTFGDKTYVHYFEDSTGGLLRSVQYKTQGDKDILLGDDLSGLTLLGYVGEDASTGVVL